MNRQALADSFFDLGRLVYVVVIAAFVIVLDLTLLDLIGIETTAQAVAQFLIVTIGAYVGLTVVDYASDAEDE